MNRALEKKLLPLKYAWKWLLDIEFPIALKDSHIEDHSILSAFPFVVLPISIVVYAIYSSFLILPGGIVGLILAGVVIAIVLEVITSWQGINLLYSVLSKKINKEPWVNSVFGADNKVVELKEPKSKIIYYSIFFMKLLLVIGLVYTKHPAWIVFAVLMNFYLKANLLTATDLVENKEFLVSDFTTSRNLILYTGVIGLLFASNLLPVAFLILISLFYFAPRLKEFCETNIGGLTEKVITLCAYLVEILVLLIGLAFFQ